jgi:hypothetical protein
MLHGFSTGDAPSFLNAMWDALIRLERVVVEQWSGLSGDEKTLAMFLALSVLFYFGKNSESYLVNTVSALIGFTLVILLAIRMFKLA